MHLKSLVLKGFKSFADRSVMSFEPGITAIVGPNGSGKSNVSDAVLWVLGERNARNLRGQAMEDVIFSGSSARKPVGMAEVDLVLDNTDGTLPVEFSEVSLTRRMYRNGESEYLINGSPARRMDFLDILHDSGIGTGTHSIIGQGQLSSILQSRPEDRRALIEEAAGVLKHKQRKEKSERKLALMDGHLTRVNDIVSEVQRQVKPLERKAKKAIAYRDASQELATLELDLAVDDLRILQGKWDSIVKEEQSVEQAANELHAQIQQEEQAAQDLQEKLQSFTAGAGEISVKHRRAQAAVDKMDSNILLFHEKKRAAVAYLAEMRISLENDSRACEAALAQRETAQGSLEQAAQSNDRAQAAQKQAQVRADDLRMQQRALQQEIDKLSHQRRDALSNLEDTRAVLARTQEVVASNKAKSQMVDTHAQDLEERLRQAALTSQEADVRRDEAQSALEQAQFDEAQIRQATGSALQNRDEARRECDLARDAHAAQSARVKSLEELQRARRAQNPLLSWAMSNIQGESSAATPLVQLVSAPEGLELVVQQLLGEDVDALFVDDFQAASAVARKLSSVDQHGSVSLLPKKAKGIGAKGTEGRRLVECLDFDQSVANAVEGMLGDVLLFDEVGQAIDFASSHQGFTCASKDGFVIWANGKVTCRHPREDETSNLADYRELEQAKRQLVQNEKDLQAAQDKADACESALREVQSKSLEVSQRVAQLKGQLQAATSEQSRAKGLLDSLSREQEKLESQKRQIAAALAKAEPDAQAYEAQVQSLVEETESLKELLDQKRSEIAPLRASADKAASELSEAKLATATCAERLAYAKRMLEACERDIRKAEDQIDRAQAGIGKKEASLDRIDPMVDLLGLLSAAAKHRADQLEQQAIQSQSQSESLYGTINEARAKIRAAHERYDAYAQRLADVRVQKSKIEMQVESAVSTIVKDCDTPLEVALDLPSLHNRSEIEENAERLRRKIASMGTINPDAAAEYEQLKTRYDYLSSQMEDMMAARKSLSRIVQAIDARMRDDFAKTFAEVNVNFQEVFAELFPGGNGSLSLVDPDDLENTGVEVSAQPPGKRILKMSLMSGGEKSLTALALLFAVYRTRATPFYILDEVEAALDDTNLRRLVAYLNTMRNDSQFIIITHQRRTMEMADVLYGISMQSDGVTKVMSQRLDKALQYAEG